MKRQPIFYLLCCLAALSLPLLAQIEEGAVAPDFSARDINGNTVELNYFRGKVILLDFWATWCPPCRAEIPHLLNIFRTFSEKKLAIIGISLDRDSDYAKQFVNEKGMNWQQIIEIEMSNQLAQQYGVEYIPFTVLIDGQGKIVSINLRGEALKKKIGELLR